MAPPAEISIPTTIITTPATGKPYTLYNITLRLPLRSFVVQKRYSDFVALHDALTRLVGAAPPEPLPTKSWFHSTVSSPEMTENRRAGLERYLRTVAESPDRRWRDTTVWRAFLNLPPGGSTASTAGSAISAQGVRKGGDAGESRVPAIGLASANAAAASDPGTWLDLHRELKGALHEARLCLARRDAATDNGGRVEAGAAAKRALVRAGSLLAALGEGLAVLQEGKRLGDGELRRRRDLVAAARVEREGLDRLSASMGTGRQGTPTPSGDKAALLSGAAGMGARTGGRVLGAPLPETERTRELDNEGMVQLQRQQMADQDLDAEALAKIVRRQKEMGLAIKDEVDRQTEMLDRMGEDVDRVERKVKVAKDRTRRLG